MAVICEEAFERSAIGMLITDAAGRVARANAAAARLVGLPLELLSGRTLRELLGDGRAAVDEALRELATGARADARLEGPLHREDGAQIWVDATLTRLAAGELFVVIADCTEQHRVQEDLRHAKEAAEAATEIKSRFLANMSHEIRTPIHTIIGMGELLADTRLDAEQREYAAQIHFAADILLELVEDTLDFSRIEAGKIAIERLDFDLVNLVEDSVDLFALEAHKKSLELVTSIHPETPRRVVSDPHRIRQIIINLVKNAIKFTHAGEIEVAVAPVTTASGREFLRFAVRDTGIGIPEQQRSRLFESFSQVDSSTTRKYGGSGLGLAICKGLAQLMGGTIGVKSREGSGSVFWFLLPLVRSGQESARAERPLEGLKVLVVDDCRAVRGVLKTYLSAAGAEVELVPDGESALDAMRRATVGRPFDVALIDTKLPGIDGWQLGSRISGDPSLNSTRLVLLTLTGKSGEEAKMMLLRWFDAYVAKPVRRDKLLDAVRRVTEERLDLEAVADAEAAQKVSGRSPSPALPAASVLVAEDHEVNQTLFRTILERMGQQVDVAANGAEAVRMAQQKPYDLIFMDLQMPELNGFEATRALRSAGIRTPVIAVTASALSEDLERCRAAGMDDFLTKPFKKKDVEPLLAKWLGPGPLQPASASAPQDLGEVLDWREAVETFMGEHALVRELVRKWCEKADGILAEIDSSLASGQLDAVRRAAHALKGSSLSLGMKRMGRAAAELEQTAAAGDLDASRRLGPVVRAARDELVRLLPRILPS